MKCESPWKRQRGLGLGLERFQENRMWINETFSEQKEEGYSLLSAPSWVHGENCATVSAEHRVIYDFFLFHYFIFLQLPLDSVRRRFTILD